MQFVRKTRRLEAIIDRLKKLLEVKGQSPRETDSELKLIKLDDQFDRPALIDRHNNFDIDYPQEDLTKNDISVEEITVAKNQESTMAPLSAG